MSNSADIIKLVTTVAQFAMQAKLLRDQSRELALKSGITAADLDAAEARYTQPIIDPLADDPEPSPI